MRKFGIVLTILVGLFLLTGCSDSDVMTNEEIIKETEKCREAGMRVHEDWDVWGLLGESGITDIICVPKYN